MQTIHIVNKRPIGFKESLHDSSGEMIPEAITPESLLKGYNLPSYNLIPSLQGYGEDIDQEWNNDPVKLVKDYDAKLRKVREKLLDSYHGEFLNTLIDQAVDKKDRYSPVKHKTIAVNDIVLLKEPFCKSIDFPMARVKQVIKNDLNEVTGAILFKGSTKEIVKRHASVIIPFLESNKSDETDIEFTPDKTDLTDTSSLDRPKRKAAQLSNERTKNLFDFDLI